MNGEVKNTNMSCLILYLTCVVWKVLEIIKKIPKSCILIKDKGSEFLDNDFNYHRQDRKIVTTFILETI